MKNKLGVCRNVDRFGTAVYRRKDDCFVGKSKYNETVEGQEDTWYIYTCYRPDCSTDIDVNMVLWKRQEKLTPEDTVLAPLPQNVVNHKCWSIQNSKYNTIKECSHVLHFTHMIIRGSSRLANFLKDFFTKTFFDIWVFRQHIEREG